MNTYECISIYIKYIYIQELCDSKDECCILNWQCHPSATRTEFSLA